MDEGVWLPQRMAGVALRGKFEESVVCRQQSTQERGIHTSFETQARSSQEVQNRVSAAPQKGLASCKNLKKKKKKTFSSVRGNAGILSVC